MQRFFFIAVFFFVTLFTLGIPFKKRSVEIPLIVFFFNVILIGVEKIEIRLMNLVKI